MMELTLSQVVEYLGTVGMDATVEGNAACCIHSVATLEDAGPDQLSFLSNPKYEKSLANTRAGAVLVKPEIVAPPDMNLIRTSDPYAAVTACIVRLHGTRRHPQWGHSSQACIATTARIGKNANIAPGVHIDENVQIGDDATIYPGVYIARGCRIGKGVTLFANVVIYEDCILGERVTLHAGTVVGEDGLGYAPVKGKWVKIPQIGNVVIGDDVEIGASCTINRATLGSTMIGSGTKFSDQIAIGHGTRVGEDCMFVAQVGIAGSVTVGRHVTMAGQVGVAGHLTIGDEVTIGAKAGVSGSIPAGQTVLGQPAVPISDCRRQLAVIQKLPRLKDEILQLRRDVDELIRRLKAEDQVPG